jgi:hypothetical protein
LLSEGDLWPSGLLGEGIREDGVSGSLLGRRISGEQGLLGDGTGEEGMSGDMLGRGISGRGWGRGARPATDEDGEDNSIATGEEKRGKIRTNPYGYVCVTSGMVGNFLQLHNSSLVEHPLRRSTILVNLALRSTVLVDLNLVELDRLANFL